MTQSDAYPNISGHTTSTGREVIVVDLRNESSGVDPQRLGELLLAPGPARCPGRGAQRVFVDDALFELTLDELVAQSDSDDAVVVHSATRTAGVLSLPATVDAVAVRRRETHRLRAALRGQT